MISSSSCGGSRGEGSSWRVETDEVGLLMREAGSGSKGVPLVRMRAHQRRGGIESDELIAGRLLSSKAEADRIYFAERFPSKGSSRNATVVSPARYSDEFWEQKKVEKSVFLRPPLLQRSWRSQIAGEQTKG
jgi:hypothetical protein